jgi:UDP-N-acetylglucosamine 2-epimerase (non-hydrolysing)
VVVVGDVNSTLAGALTAKKLGFAVAHVEAGLRSRDLTMPEEINRLLTDAVADWLLVSEPSGVENLLSEGRPAKAIHQVGNVMIDTLYFELNRLRAFPVNDPLPPKPFAVLTLHRPANVDRKEKLRELMEAVTAISNDLPVYFPMHPRTRERLKQWGLDRTPAKARLHLGPPLSYRHFLHLWKEAALVLTDSGGLQEETTALGIPCFTIRDNTERPITVTQGSNLFVGTTGQGLLEAFARFKRQGPKKGRVPELWDGHAAERILDVLARG